MPKQHGTRRWILGALVVLAMALMGLPSGPEAGAKDDSPRPRPDYGSRDLFKLECELLGGTFTEALGFTYCHHDAGTVQCDANGNNCTFHPARYQPGGGATMPAPTGERHTSDGGGTGFPGPAGGPSERPPDTLPNFPVDG